MLPLAARCFVLLSVAVVIAPLPAAITEALSRPVESAVWIAVLGVTSFLVVPLLPNWRVEASLDQPVIVAAAVVLPPPLVMLLGFIGLANEGVLRRDTSWWFGLFNKAQLALSMGLASVAARWLATHVADATVTSLAMTAAAILVQEIANVLLVSTFVALLGRAGWAEAARSNIAPFPRFASSFLLVGLLAILVVIPYDQVGGLAVVLLALPLALGYNAMRSAKESEDRAQQLARQVHELEMLNVLGGQLLSANSVHSAHEATQQALRSALNSGSVVVALDGVIPPGLSAAPVRGAEPAVIGVPGRLTEGSAAVVEAVGDLLGVTLQRVELAEQLAEVQQARAALAGRILEEGTRERSRIALEIHDDVLPYLAGAGIQSDNVRSALEQQELAIADRLAAATSAAINGGIAQLREVLDALRKQIIVPGGLVPGLEEALEDLRLRHGVDGRFEVPPHLPDLPLAVEILVLETVRGCLTNVARHAGAETVEVHVACTTSFLTATVCDDGKGFDPDAVPEGHHGLSLMAQRVELARGRFTVTSATGAGTRVHMEVPL